MRGGMLVSNMERMKGKGVIERTGLSDMLQVRISPLKKCFFQELYYRDQQKKVTIWNLCIQINTVLFKADTLANYTVVQKYHYLKHFGNFYDNRFWSRRGIFQVANHNPLGIKSQSEPRRINQMGVTGLSFIASGNVKWYGHF